MSEDKTPPENLEPTSRAKRISQLFLKACELDAEQRDAFLDEACAGDAELRAEVESLLAHDPTGVLGTRSLTEQVRSMHAELGTDSHPSSIGPYKILDVLGEGGMGIVYVAEQETPVRRKVAVKVIKRGMDTKQVVARFEAERQALAMMNHPNVAKVFDAGATEQGRPYFAMELVKGEPITKHCDRQRLTTHERLELFQQVCSGVQHAHQKGIIHRDIKPSNVLVQVRDGERVPKIIDFGVAKATAQRLTERTLFTELGVLIGTPEYMSPEQAEMTAEDIDTRTDVYSLGVLLYELLVGALPFDPKKLREAGFDEIRRRIREDEPSKPSTRLSTLGDVSTESAKRRRTDLRALRRQLSGDLDWITMKTLEKDRTRRYDSPNELAADIRRHLKHEPVVAGPPSTVYQARKFVRRHRVGVAMVAVALAVLVGFAVRERLHAAAIARERDRANEAAMTAEQVSEFLVGLFEVSNPSESRGNTITAREILDQGAAKIEHELADQPAVQARLMETIGGVYRSLGLYDDALSLVEESLEKRRDALGPEHLEVADSLHALAYVLWEKGDYTAAEPLNEEALAIREKALAPDDAKVADSLQRLASSLWSKGDYAAARPLLERSLEIQEQTVGWMSEDVAKTLLTLGALHYSLGDYAKAQEVWWQTLEVQEEVLHPEHPNLAMTLNNLAVVMLATGDFAGARPLLERSIGIQERTLGPDHPNLASGLDNLADLLREMGDYDAARPLYDRAIRIQEAAVGPEHPELARFLEDLGVLLLKSGDPVGARELFDRSLSIREKMLGAENSDTASSRVMIAMVDSAQGRFAEAEVLLRGALATLEQTSGPDHEITARARKELGLAYMHQGRFSEAEAQCKRAVGALEAAVGRNHPYVAGAAYCLASVYERMGEYEKAEALHERALEIRHRVLGSGHVDVVRCLLALAQLRAAQDRDAEAETFYERAERALRESPGSERLDVAYEQSRYWTARGDRAEALRFLRRAAELGYPTRWLGSDPDLASLRNDPEFEAIVAEVKKRIAEE